MAVEYSREACESFVGDARTLLSPPHFVAFWYYLAFGRLICSDAIQAAQRLAAQWQTMSLWNRQGVLYLMAPLVGTVAQEAARESVKRARLEAPL